MSAPTAAEGAVRLSPSADARLAPYALIAVGALVATLVLGQPELVALAVPFALALALGLRRTGRIPVRGRVRLEREPVLEGDAVAGSVALEWDGPFEAQVLLHRLRGMAPVGPVAWSLPPGSRAAELPLRLRAEQWGRHTPLEVWLRLEQPLGLLTWTGRVLAAPPLRVLPGTERLTRSLELPEARAVLGTHRSRRRGDGSEFAELRPYAPGDRLRDLNWRATGRHRRPFVNRYHPELSGDVVIAIDAFDDGSATSAAALSRAGRVAWALATVHLRANDRVGLAGLGGSTRWLPPGGGRLARYRLLEVLLRIGGEAVDPIAREPAAGAAVLPPAALVVALTPLHDPATLATLTAWRARGRAVAAVVIDATDLLEAPASPAEALARRVWAVELERRRRALAGVGVGVVSLGSETPVTSVIRALRRGGRAPALRRAR